VINSLPAKCFLPTTSQKREGRLGLSLKETIHEVFGKFVERRDRGVWLRTAGRVYTFPCPLLPGLSEQISTP
jgi:hypothetical protein